MDLMRLVRGPRALPRWAIASLAANIGIVVTGGLVRLTGSGLGCPTWPRCTPDSFVAHPALGAHGAIEFGNRLLTFVLIIIAVLTFASAMAYRDPARAERGGRRPDLRRLAAALALGIPAQAVVGGLTVLFDLNPYLVGLHLLLSMVLIALAVLLVRKTRGLSSRPVSPSVLALVRLTFLALWVAVVLGTVLTGSGPHAGDERVPRNGLDGMLLTQLHSAVAYTTVALTLASVVAASQPAGPAGAGRRGAAGGNRHRAVQPGAAGSAGRPTPARCRARGRRGHQPGAQRAGGGP